MKRVLSVLLALCLLLGAVPTLAFAADSDFVIEDGVLTEYNGPGGEVVVPDGVTVIGRNAFAGREDVTGVDLPDGVTKIEAMAFERTGLVTIDMPDSVTEIGDSSFNSCKNLFNVRLSKNLKTISAYAFQYCDNIYFVKIPKGVTSIGMDAFSSCKNLGGIEVPSSVTEIRGFAFNKSSNLRVVFYAGSKSDWEKISIGDNKEFDSAKFTYNLSWADTDFCVRGDGLLQGYYGSDADVIIPSGIKEVYGGVFETNKTVETVTIPEGVKSIYGEAFDRCPNLKSVKIPVSTTYIMFETFVECDNLTDIYYAGTKEQWNKISSEYDYAKKLTEQVTMHYSSGGETPSTNFTDVKPNAYYANAVKWAVENGITSGIGGGKFAPESTCKREQIVTFLYRAMGSPAVAVTDSFVDMPKNEEFQRAISWAVEKKITSGVGGGRFAPGKGCTRAEAMTFIWRAAGRPEPSAEASFADMPKNADFRKAISWAYEHKITSGTGDGTKFSPDQTCTRGQIVTFLYNARSIF